MHYQIAIIRFSLLSSYLNLIIFNAYLKSWSCLMYILLEEMCGAVALLLPVMRHLQT